MFGFKVDQARGLFFDRARVMRAVDDGTRRVFSRFGAFVRTRARSSIRKRKGVSDPGSPPSSHLGLLKQFIFFAYDPIHRSVVIGPAKLNGRLGDAPAALERGGESLVLSGTRRKRKVRKVNVRPRPYMQPAFETELKGLPNLWRNAVKK